MRLAACFRLADVLSEEQSWATPMRREEVMPFSSEVESAKAEAEVMESKLDEC